MPPRLMASNIRHTNFGLCRDSTFSHPVQTWYTIRGYGSVHNRVTSNISGPHYWTSISKWRDVDTATFLSYHWQVKNSLNNPKSVYEFLDSVLPPRIQKSVVPGDQATKEEFIVDVAMGLKRAPMAIRLTPHILSLIDWNQPYADPLRRQFLPLKSSAEQDHPKLALDSLHETKDSPVPGLVHRYPDKVLFLATSVCPVYCRFCTRSYAIGAQTETVKKQRFLPLPKKWEAMFDYIARTPQVQDVVVSGGDSYQLEPEQVRAIGRRLLSIENVKRIRFASKGLAVCPSRIADPDDPWTAAVIEVSRENRVAGKSVALHTHFNHPKEITWVTERAAQVLFANGVTVRNQTVLLNQVNNDVDTMKLLIRKLANMNIQPYYIYQGDMVRGVEDLRTPLREILHLESQIRGTIAGFMTPSFVVDLLGGGGKRLANSFEFYDPDQGVSRFKAPGVTQNTVHEYYDPLWSLPLSQVK